MVLKRVGVLSAGKVVAVLQGGFGLIIGAALYNLVAGIAGGVELDLE